MPPLGKLLAARKTGSIVLILEDMTRHSPLPEILPVILREIEHAGVDLARVLVFVATGMHPPLTAAQVRQKLGPCADGLAWRAGRGHDWVDVAPTTVEEIAYERVPIEALISVSAMVLGFPDRRASAMAI